jgi:hypothetical protein
MLIRLFSILLTFYGAHIVVQYGEQMQPNIPLISSFPAGDICSSPTCRAIVQDSLNMTAQFLRALEDLTEKHEKTVVKTDLHLDAVNALKNAYMAFGRRLEDEDIKSISQRAGIPYDIPGNHKEGSYSVEMGENDGNGYEASGSEYTDLSSTGL